MLDELAPGVVLVHGERIQAIGPAGSVRVPPEAELRRAAAVLPGLIAGHSPQPGADALSVEPERLALDLVDRFADRGPWLEAGITAVSGLALLGFAVSEWIDAIDREIVAIQEVAGDFAESVVTSILEGF